MAVGRETREEKILRRAAADVQSHFSSTAAFRPMILFVVTWDKVGYYDQQYDKVRRDLFRFDRSFTYEGKVHMFACS